MYPLQKNINLDDKNYGIKTTSGSFTSQMTFKMCRVGGSERTTQNLKTSNSVKLCDTSLKR